MRRVLVRSRGSVARRHLRRRGSTGSTAPWLASFLAGFACIGALVIALRTQAPAMPPTPAARAGVSLEEEWREKLGPERLKNIDRLHDYWTRGEFVENPVPTGGPGHFILDAKGRPCPLAYIIIASGRRDLIEQAAREKNGVKVADLKSGPILEWILHSGLTQEECVLIQQPSRSGQDVARDVRAEEKARLARKLESVEETLRLANGDSLDVAVRRVMALSVQARH